MTRAASARCAAAFCILLAARDARAAPKVSAHLEPDPLGREELATLTIVVESAGFGTPDVRPDFRLDNFEHAGGPFRSSSQSWVNGVTSSSIQLIWRLRPLAVGPAAVRALRVEVQGELVQLPDAQIQIVAEAPRRTAPQRRSPPDPFGSLFGADPFGRLDPRRPRPSAAEPKLQVRAELEPTTVWAGQQLVWRLVLDTQTDISRVEPRQMPDFRGFWVRDITPEKTPEPRWLEIDGERYARVPVLERALFALEPGRLTIPPVEVQVVAQIVDVDYYRPIARPRAYDLSTGTVSVTVKPLPAPPAGSGADVGAIVGRLQLSAGVDRTAIETGQAASLTLTATSTGNLQSLAPPVLDLPDGVRAFPPTRESDETVLGGRLETTVRWRYVLLADRAGGVTLPPVELPFFDPESAAYRVARTAPIELAVRQASTIAAPPAAQASSEPQRDEQPEAVSRGASAGVGLGRGVLVAGLAAALALALGVVWTRRRHSGRPAQDLAAALAGAERETSARLAAAQIEEAWRRFLAERWSIARSLPPGQWGARLASQGAPAEAGAELANLFEELHFLAYAPELAEIEAHRTEVLARSRQLLRRLR